MGLEFEAEWGLSCKARNCHGLMQTSHSNLSRAPISQIAFMSWLIALITLMWPNDEVALDDMWDLIPWRFVDCFSFIQ